jgi:hypothetical protein
VNPWYRGREGNVQGRSGGALDGKAADNPSGPNQIISAAKSAPVGSSSK